MDELYLLIGITEDDTKCVMILDSVEDAKWFITNDEDKKYSLLLIPNAIQDSNALKCVEQFLSVTFLEDSD